MKKSTLILACLVGLAMLASCKKDPVEPEKDPTAPTISAVSANYDEVYSGDEITVGFNATGENLTKIDMTASLNGEVIYSHSESIDKAASYNYSHTFTVEGVGIVTISGTVSDAAGQTASASFDLTTLEKPNAKFIGHYEGDAMFTGSMDVSTFSYHQELNNEPLPSSLDIVAGDNMNEVVATFKVGEQSDTATGVVDGNTISFGTINGTVVQELPYVGSQTINMTYNNITVTLNGNELLLDGSCSGNGVGGMLTLSGTIGGSLTKTE